MLIKAGVEKDWHDRYIFRLMDAGLIFEEAEDNLSAIKGDIDYNDDNPEDAADAELSYMGNDG